MTSSPPVLTGAWTKISKERCAEQYPDQLEFGSGGLYFGRKDGGGFTQWDAGTWQFDGAEQVKISTANDAIVPYTVNFSGEVLSFTDPEGCTIRYRRK
jgi:hypothetical protein